MFLLLAGAGIAWMVRQDRVDQAGRDRMERDRLGRRAPGVPFDPDEDSARGRARRQAWRADQELDRVVAITRHPARIPRRLRHRPPMRGPEGAIVIGNASDEGTFH